MVPSITGSSWVSPWSFPFLGGIPHVQSNPQKYPMISPKKYPVKSDKITRDSHKSSCHARKHCLFRPESHHHHLCGKNRLNKRHGLILQQCRMGMEKPIIRVLFLWRLLLLLVPDGQTTLPPLTTDFLSPKISSPRITRREFHSRTPQDRDVSLVLLRKLPLQNGLWCLELSHSCALD